ncbi:Pyrimidine pathway regulatory protein 1 [Botrytis cinerea]
MPALRACGAVCEYFDTTKGKKISRTYVIKLQEKVRALEMELSQLVEEEGNSPDSEDIVRPGGLIRLNDDDETPRFLGPSSGIAMTRIVMEEAKKYTDTRSIRELVPEVRQRRTPAQSPDTVSERKKSYPMISAVPAPTLPSRLVTDKLVEVFSQKAQYMLPTLHEPTFAKNLQEVYDGDNDPYKNFVLRMVLAISMQKLDLQAKDIKTLQCLVLIAQYSMLTPTRTAIYYIVGLATRLCQQLGLAEEKTITQGVSIGLVDPLQLDMRRRLAWIVLSMELGLAQSMGRPNAFATGRDHLDIQFFQTVDDEYITSNGVLPGPMSDKKRFNGRYNTMIIFLFRPSPQVPQPSYHSAIMCYDAASSNIRTQSDQIKTAMIDLTWPFLLSLFMAINTVLWSISYSEVRALHTKEELEEHISLALDIVARSRERWPGTQATSELYMTLTKACLKSYELGDNSLSSFSATSPSLTDANSPSASEHSSATSTSLPQSQHNAQLNNAYQSPHDSDTSSTKCQSRYLHMTTTIRYLHCNRPFGPIQSLIYTTTATTILSYALDTCLKYTAASDATSSAAATNAAVDNLEAGLRSGSLSQEQQTELMHSLETEGLTEINNFMNPVPQYEHPIKYEQ